MTDVCYELRLRELYEIGGPWLEAVTGPAGPASEEGPPDDPAQRGRAGRRRPGLRWRRGRVCVLALR